MADEELHEDTSTSADAVNSNAAEAESAKKSAGEAVKASEDQADGAADQAAGKAEADTKHDDDQLRDNAESSTDSAQSAADEGDEVSQGKTDESGKANAPVGDAKKASKKRKSSKSGDDDDDADDIADEDLDLPMDEIEALLNADSADRKGMSAQMRRVAQRQAESSRRVEETIKNTKANPRWFVPLFVTLLVVGLLWAVVYYMTNKYPIPGLGQWNLAVAFAIMMVGFIMTVAWH